MGGGCLLAKGLGRRREVFPTSLVPLKLGTRTDPGVYRCFGEWKGNVYRGLAFEAWLALLGR